MFTANITSPTSISQGVRALAKAALLGVCVCRLPGATVPVAALPVAAVPVEAVPAAPVSVEDVPVAAVRVAGVPVAAVLLPLGVLLAELCEL